MMKLTKAPFLKYQNNEPYEELIILAGSEAWQAWGKGEGQGWHLLTELIKADYKKRPIILGADQLTELNSLQISPKEKKVIGIYRFGELSSNQITAIVLNLAKQTEAEIVALKDNIGQVVENLSNYIERTRKGDTAAEIITQEVIATTVKPDKDNLLPYIEERTESGKKGLYRIIPKLDKDTGEINERVQWLSDVVNVIGIGRSENESYLVLQWQLEGSYQKVVEALPLGDIGEREGWRTLKNRGLKVTTNTSLKNELADYLQNSGNRTLWTVTHATGWQNGAYILPNGEVIGHPEIPVLFRSQSSSFSGYDTKGTLGSWQKEIAQYVRGNPSMMLGVAVALSAPLIHHLNVDSFGVHLFGGSTSGKTTTANIANSIYGHPEITRVSWNATSLGLTNEAAARNDGFLVMDEIGQGANKKHIEQTAYALFNGVGKIQGAKEGGNRELSRWRIMAFSTGEIDLEGYLSQAGIKTNAGQLVRLLNVPISPAKQFYQFSNGKAHADHLNHASKLNYGVIGREWVKWITAHQNELDSTYQVIKAKWLQRLPKDVSSQVQRVSNRFAVLETALQLAHHLTQWSEAENAEALLHCFNEWVNIFGLHSREEKQVIEQVNGWLLANAESRFITYPPTNQAPIKDIAGYRVLITDNNKEEFFYLYPLAFNEAINGNSKEQACKILADKGMLKRGEGAYKWLVRLPHKIDTKRTRCYMLFPLIEPDCEETGE
ncbi:DUF927 domain-containing protein [Gallibacterium sp. ZY190522]